MDVIILKSEPQVIAARIDLDPDEARSLRRELASLNHGCSAQPLVCRILRDLAPIPDKEPAW